MPALQQKKVLTTDQQGVYSRGLAKTVERRRTEVVRGRDSSEEGVALQSVWLL